MATTTTTTITRQQAVAMVDAGRGVLWSARCDAYGEIDDHILAWAWIRGREGIAEGVHIEPGTVRLSDGAGNTWQVAS